jgi:hypothetical protein
MGKSRMAGRHSRHSFMAWRLAVTALLGGLLSAAPLRAAPPPDADPAMAPWFNSLRQPGSGISCCSIADCRPVDYRTVGDHYEAYIEGEWRPVPPDKVLTRADNPTGRAVVCWTKLSGIMCFVRGPET